MIPRLLVLLCASGIALVAQPAPPAVPGWIGIGIEDAGDIAKDADALEGLGLKINQVFGESPGWIGGLRTGDVLVCIDGKPLVGARAELVAAFKTAIGAKGAGERVRFVLRRTETKLDVAAGVAPVRPATARGDADPPLDDPRAWLAGQPPGTKLAIDGAVVQSRLEIEIVLGVRPGERASPDPPPNPLAFAGYPLGAPGQGSELARLSRLLVRAGAAQLPNEDLAKRIAAVEAGNEGFRLEVVRALHVDPFRLERATDRLARDLLRVDDPAARAPWAAFRLLGLSDPAAGGGRESPATTPAELLQAIDRSMERAHAHVVAAFAAWTDLERASAPARLEALFEALGEGIYLFGDLETKPTRRAATRELLALATRVDVARFEAARAELAWMLDREAFALAIARVDWGAPADRARAIVFELDTPRGKLAIGGTGNDVHREQDYAVLIELGGDDVHANNAGASVPGKIPIALVVDLGGDDAYESHRRYAQGVGALGLGALVDIAGDDRYVAAHVAQGCGIFGLGLLVDCAGRDRYRALTLSQGVGLVGVGALVDLAGDDRYDAQLYAQGLGLARGVGMVVDRAGDDEYYAKGLRPTGYGTAGVFDAWSQGCGLGFRLDASGGVGILADGDGRDHYEAGNFAQGGGYYYGWGALVDLGGADDRYVASRYGMGWSAHQALGSFLEDGGDDWYQTRHGVICGLAWDESATVFVDRGGNDRYDTGFFSLGASAHNAVCVFADLGGRDRYRGAPPGRVGGNDYHGGTSWSLFVDAGGSEDDYGPPTDAVDYGDDRVRTGTEHWGFADLPGSIAHALVVGEALGGKGGGDPTPGK